MRRAAGNRRGGDGGGGGIDEGQHCGGRGRVRAKGEVIGKMLDEEQSKREIIGHEGRKEGALK